MSGIVGILQSDGQPLDRGVLDRMTVFLAFRGPDAQQTWVRGSVGFGHAMLRTTSDAQSEYQPACMDGRFWITADARLDDRQSLIAKLQAAGRNCSHTTTDPDLILHAYAAWNDVCIEYLLGDFAFAIWDAESRRLFCARDRFGVKPFYFARIGKTLIFSNTLECIRLHPAVSNKLNDLAIADFLLFDMNQEPGTTTFADVQRLPAAHALKCDRETFSVRRYWTLSVTQPVHFKQDREYLECFGDLLDKAVADRLRANSACVLMSGGLDSTTVAASAKRLLAQDKNGSELFAYTYVLDRLIPDEERHYVGLVATKLGIPTEFQVLDDCQLFGRSGLPQYRSPEPEHSAWPDRLADLLSRIAQKSRVALTGQGSDPGFSSRITVHFRQLLHNKQFLRAWNDAVRYLTAERRFSRLYLRGRFRLLFSTGNPFYTYPAWINRDLEKTLGLRDRWMLHEVGDRKALMRLEAHLAAFRPEASFAMSHISWQNVFEGLDPGVTRVPVEIRHPFFDLRIVTFLLGLPRLPWCCDKELLRQSGRGLLPDRVRFRAKSPLQADPVVALLKKPESAWVDRFQQASELERYVRRDQIPGVWKEGRPGVAWVNLRPLSLNFWLRGR